MGSRVESETHTPTPEQYLQGELGQRIYSRAELLRLRALAKVGISTEGILAGVRHRVTLRSPDYRLQVELGADSQLRTSEDTLRLVVIKDNPYQGEDFHRGRFFEPSGKMWQQADSSQGQPWYPSAISSYDLAMMLTRLDQLEASSYHVEVKLSSYQQVPAETSAS